MCLYVVYDFILHHGVKLRHDLLYFLQYRIKRLLFSLSYTTANYVCRKFRTRISRCKYETKLDYQCVSITKSVVMMLINYLKAFIFFSSHFCACFPVFSIIFFFKIFNNSSLYKQVFSHYYRITMQ